MTAVLSVSNLSKTFFGQRVLSDGGPGGRRGRGARADRPERQRQVHADQGAGRRTTSRIRAARCTSTARRWRSARRPRARRPGCGSCTRTSVWSSRSARSRTWLSGPGYASTRLGLISWSRERRDAEQTLGRLGHDIDVTRPVGELPMASRTAVAVARALSSRSGEPKVVVLDEPTASLPPHETRLLLRSGVPGERDRASRSSSCRTTWRR